MTNHPFITDHCMNENIDFFGIEPNYEQYVRVNAAETTATSSSQGKSLLN